MSNFLLKAGSIGVVLYLFKAGTTTGARSFDRVVNWGRGVITGSNLNTLTRQLQLDYGFSGNFPPDFPAWVRESIRENDGSDPALDFWGETYKLRRDAGGIKGAFELRSCGPDKSCDTPDDIVATGRGQTLN